MSFTFRVLQLENWLAYSGQTTIRFPEYQPGRNLVVIYGRNGYGKTSLLRALRYVFEGERLSRDELLDLWHESARDTDEGCLEVALEFTHGGRQCKIVRGCDFSLRGRDFLHSPRVDLFFDGQREESLVEDKIQELLPRDCLDFLFFDGAEMSRYALRENNRDTKEAIEKILGIPAARNLRDDLGKVIKTLEREQQGLLQERKEAQALVREVSELEEQLDRYRERKSTQMERKRSLETVKTELEAERDKVRVIEKDLDALREKKARRAYIDERMQEIDVQIRGVAAKLSVFMLENILQQIVEEMRAREQVSPRSQALDARLRTLREVVNEGICLCGREIDSVIEAKFREQLASLERLFRRSDSATGVPSEELVNLSGLLHSLHAQRFDPEELIDRRAELDIEREEVEIEIARLRKHLQGHPDADVADISQQLGEVKQQIRDLAGIVGGINENIRRTETELIKKKRALDQVGVADEQVKGVTRTLQEARKAETAISELLDRLVKEKRTAIEAKATEVFRSITNKPQEYDCLRICEDYSLEVVRRDGTTLRNERLSAGEKEVVAYSFITALNLSSPDPAPFVMDTPFGHLDAGHRQGLLNSLPNLHVQAFLLATDRDLPREERDSIDRFLAKEFVLKRDQERASTSIEEDEG